MKKAFAALGAAAAAVLIVLSGVFALYHPPSHDNWDMGTPMLTLAARLPAALFGAVIGFLLVDHDRPPWGVACARRRAALRGRPAPRSLHARSLGALLVSQHPAPARAATSVPCQAHSLLMSQVSSTGRSNPWRATASIARPSCAVVVTAPGNSRLSTG
jgi:hypothetical protein